MTLSLDTAYRSFGGEVEASSTPTICRLPDSRRHQIWAIAPNAQAKQQCSATTPSSPHGRWWSYRLIDGRKCWYEGKPMLSKSLLEWPKEASAQPVSNGEITSVVTEKPGTPLDSQPRATEDSETLESRQRGRTE